MNILIDDQVNWLDANSNMLAIIENVALTTLKQEEFPLDVEISLTLTDNETIKKINFDYRNIDATTDVISFPQIDWINENIAPSEYVNPVEGDILLGDIIISTQQLQEQATRYGHSVERECAFLVAHSMLHLLGYDHVEKEEEMFAKQEAILQIIGLGR